MIGFIFNNDPFDDPYNQTAVKKGFTALDKYVGELGEHPFYSFGTVRSDFSHNYDDYVIVQHTRPLSTEEKQKICELIKTALTLKKSFCKDGSPELFIVFDKKNEDDCFVF